VYMGWVGNTVNKSSGTPMRAPLNILYNFYFANFRGRTWRFGGALYENEDLVHVTKTSRVL
jgi:hypothetical protein